MTVYIYGINNFPVDDWGISMLIGCKLKGAKVKLYEDINEVPLNRESMVVGWIEDTKEFFKNMGYVVDYNITLPHELHKEKYLKRDIQQIATFQALKYINLPFFIKPNNVKSFEHGIIKRQLELLKYKNNSDFIVSDVVDILSEYRCYIIDRKIVGCYNYLGDFYLYPNLKLVEEMIKDFKQAPMGYSIDVGILSNGETCLIECNDGWSLGNYGLDSKLYCRLLTERWIEILKQNMK